MASPTKMQRVDSERWIHIRIMSQVRGVPARDLVDRYLREGLLRDRFPEASLTPLPEGRRHRPMNFVNLEGS